MLKREIYTSNLKYCLFIAIIIAETTRLTIVLQFQHIAYIMYMLTESDINTSDEVGSQQTWMYMNLDMLLIKKNCKVEMFPIKIN